MLLFRDIPSASDTISGFRFGGGGGRGDSRFVQNLLFLMGEQFVVLQPNETKTAGIPVNACPIKTY